MSNVKIPSPPSATPLFILRVAIVQKSRTMNCRESSSASKPSKPILRQPRRRARTPRVADERRRLRLPPPPAALFIAVGKSGPPRLRPSRGHGRVPWN